MKLKFSKNEKIHRGILYLLVASTILLSRESLVVTLKLGFYKSIIIYTGIIGILYGYFFIKNRKEEDFFSKWKNQKNTKISMLLIGGILILMVLKLDFQMYLISIIVYILAANILCEIFTFDKFMRYSSNIIVVIAIISLITNYVMRESLLFPNGVLNSNIPLIENSAGLLFFDFKISFVVALPFYLRNFGVFREPGVFQFFLLIPLIYEMFLNKKTNRYFKIIILSITVFSTMSATGLITLVMIWSSIIIQKVIIEKNKKLFKISIIVGGIFIVVCGVAYFSNENIKNVTNELLNKVTTINSSTSARMESIIKSTESFIEKPILGNKFSEILMQVEHNTNTTFSIFAIFGVIGGTINLIGIYCISNRFTKNKFQRIYLSIIIFILINTQFLLGNSFFWTLFIIQFANKEKVKLPELEMNLIKSEDEKCENIMDC